MPTPRILRSRYVSMPPPPSSNCPDSLQHILKTQPHVLKEGMTE